jgi:hypothetical protein
MALRRRAQVAELRCKLSGQFKGIIGTYGIQSAIARILGVNRSTVCRDLQAIEKERREEQEMWDRIFAPILQDPEKVAKMNELTRKRRKRRSHRRPRKRG